MSTSLQATSDRPEPPPKRVKPTLSSKPSRPGEGSPSPIPKVAIKPPDGPRPRTRSRGKEENPDSSPKPVPRKPRPSAKSSGKSGASELTAMDTSSSTDKPKPLPRSRKSTGIAEKPDNTVAPQLESPTKRVGENLAPVGESTEKEQEEKMETDAADNKREAVAVETEKKKRSPTPSAEPVKMEVDKRETKSPTEDKEESIEKAQSKISSGENKEEERKSSPDERKLSPEIDAQQRKKEGSDSTAGAETPSGSVNGEVANDELANGTELAKKLGFEVIGIDEVKHTERVASEDQMSSDARAEAKEKPKQPESPSNKEEQATTPAVAKEEVDTAKKAAVKENPKVLVVSKRKSQVLEPKSPTEVKVSNGQPY